MKSVLLSLILLSSTAHGLVVEPTSRRSALKWFGVAAATSMAPPAFAESSTPDSLDVDNFIRTGVVANPMGVSGQAGKSRPETGIIFREGSDVSRDSRTGDVLAEILLDSKEGGKAPYLASYSSPWPLAKGTVFDIECRDAKTGDGAFLAVTSSVNGKSMSELKDQFFVEQLFSPTGRFSFYGPPTDVKVQKSEIEGDLRTLDLSFSTVSQATQTEIPRKARLRATVPSGSNQAVMLVASSSAPRWKKSDVEKGVDQAMNSFQAIPAPKTSLKTRGKERRG